MDHTRRTVTTVLVVGLLIGAIGGIVASLRDRDDRSGTVTVRQATPERVSPAEPPATDDPTAAAATTLAEIERTTAEDIRLDGVLTPTVLASNVTTPVVCHEPTTARVAVESHAANETGSWEMPEVGDDEVAVRQGATTGAVVVIATGGGLAALTTTTGDGRSDRVTVDPAAPFAVSAHRSVVPTPTPTAPPAPTDPAPTDPAWPIFTTLANVTIEWTDGTTTLVDMGGPGFGLLVDRHGNRRSSEAEARRNLGSECVGSPAPTLPPAGRSQPEPGAEATVRSLVERSTDSSIPIEERAALTDQPERMIELASQVPFLQESRVQNASTKVRELVFVDADTAIAIADLYVAGQLQWTNAWAKVVRTDGQWRLTADSICALSFTNTMPACAGSPLDYPPEARRVVPRR